MRIILASKPEKLENIEAQRQVRHLYKMRVGIVNYYLKIISTGKFTTKYAYSKASNRDHLLYGLYSYRLIKPKGVVEGAQPPLIKL